MRKICLFFSLIVLLGFPAFGDAKEQEEIDHLLFLPNSSDRFVDEEQAVIQLDNLANYLKGRGLLPGQVIVYGYTAAVTNDIDSDSLSAERALFVINELEKRGVSKNLFSDPVGYGSVDIWGSNANEENRSPNRRVRILLDGSFLTPKTVSSAEVIEVRNETPPVQEQPVKKSCAGFPWKILLPLLLLALLALILFFVFRSRKNSDAKTAPAAEQKPAAVTSVSVVNLDDEIRFRAYELHLERNGQYGDADGDWYRAVNEVCARYEADGFQTNSDTGSWLAKKTIVTRA